MSKKLYFWTEEQDQILKNNVGKFIRYSYLRRDFLPDKSVDAIGKRARELGLNNPCANSKFTFNRNYFSNPNYRNSFWSGWLAADGCIHIRKGGHKDLSWTMESIDSAFLDMFKKDLDYTGNIYNFYNDGIKYKNKDGENHSRIHLHSLRGMADDLEKNFNIIPNKTYRLGPPILKDIELKLAYLVGYTNGDGCIAFDQKKGVSFRFQGAGKKLIEWCRDLFLSLKIKTPRNRIPSLLDPSGSEACKLFVISGIAALRMYELLKLVPVPVLERKWIRPEIDEYIAAKKLKHPEYFAESIDSIMTRNNIDFSRKFD
jgi:hypothetical protein